MPIPLNIPYCADINEIANMAVAFSINTFNIFECCLTTRAKGRYMVPCMKMT